jgi:annexin A7/11
MKDGLLHIVRGLKPKHLSLGEGVWRDTKLLEKTMAGFGTKDRLLIIRYASNIDKIFIF